MEKLKIWSCVKQWLLFTLKNYFRIWGCILLLAAPCIILLGMWAWLRFFAAQFTMPVIEGVIKMILVLSIMAIGFGKATLYIYRAEKGFVKSWVSNTIRKYAIDWKYHLLVSTPVVLLTSYSVLFLVASIPLLPMLILFAIPSLLVALGRMILKIYRSEPVMLKEDIKFAFKNDMWWKSIVFYIVLIIGGALCALTPGSFIYYLSGMLIDNDVIKILPLGMAVLILVYLYVSWFPAMIFLSDSKAGPIDALSKSTWSVRKAGFFRILSVFLISIAVAIAVSQFLTVLFKLLAIKHDKVDLASLAVKYLMLPPTIALPVVIYEQITQKQSNELSSSQ
ncbi:hypothetical protein MMH89_02410 [Candidatus Comchoanobacter bicostacola]|uniref:Glycerophosphoryl diester phosphodiesterase membrane domain-containing protein n=1 Tax=Candidatus Comchoanobacter bicostacola TaxID=2919598 RepID=A0ABY5DK24_9GAMM|nr:hypothetical protein [Candidatus Comchoanobacter bicostacola]UTC24079.1 hypothetical protein MMH89_02410 [Candidatus Comchoanobacter bicostacola]